MKTRRWLSGAMLLLTLGSVTANADSISDVLFVGDTHGFLRTKGLFESHEAGKVTIKFPRTRLRLTEQGSTRVSDTLIIPSFIVTLSSDRDTTGLDIGEFKEITIAISATSDGDPLSGVSDTLTVDGVTKSLVESKEPGKIQIEYPGMVVPLLEPGGTATSDTLTIPKFTVTLESDGDHGLAGQDVGPPLSDTIFVSAASDVPEPSTFILLGIGMVGVLRRKLNF